MAASPGDDWGNIHAALRAGNRGLPGVSSLPRLLASRRGARNHMALPPLTEAQILAWAEGHHQRTGRWPQVSSGPVTEAPGEAWRAINAALERGLRGLPGAGPAQRLQLELKNERIVRVTDACVYVE